MSWNGQSAADVDEPTPEVVVCTFPMPAGTVFDWHTHDDHQLAWAARGVLTVRSGSSAWVLPRTRALWIPQGVRHETLSDSTTTMRTAYVRPQHCPITWTECTPVIVSTLMADLLEYLMDDQLDAVRRAHAQNVLVDLLEPVSVVSFDVQMPTEERSRRVAELLVEDPSDDRTMAQWGHQVGASSRTLARAFVAETHMPFGRWRSLLRLRAAMTALADGEPVANVARSVGYESVSAFVAAFRRETGITPAAYFKREADRTRSLIPELEER
jgi:AraC-like DNA-binding protein/quercetin dioxygenase-like cupin family protein